MEDKLAFKTQGIMERCYFFFFLQ